MKYVSTFDTAAAKSGSGRRGGRTQREEAAAGRAEGTVTAEEVGVLSEETTAHDPLDQLTFFCFTNQPQEVQTHYSTLCVHRLTKM